MKYLSLAPVASFVLAACAADSGRGTPSGSAPAQSTAGSATTGTTSTGTGSLTGNPGEGIAFDPAPSSGTVETFTATRPCEIGTCTDFPSTPVFSGSTTEGVESGFSGNASGAGPCITDPMEGSLMPVNWWRPRVKFQGGSAPYQITFSSAWQASDLVVYTDEDEYLLHADVWASFSQSSWGDAAEDTVTITVRDSAGGSSTTSFNIAPVEAGGSMVYWSTVSQGKDIGNTRLEGVTVGLEGISDALTAADVAQESLGANGTTKQAEAGASAGQFRCIGCHTSTPDGEAVAFVDDWPWNAAVASVAPDSTGASPSYITETGRYLLNQPWQGVMTFSVGDWTAGNRRMLIAFSNRVGNIYSPMQRQIPIGYTGQSANLEPTELVWFDLATTASAPTPQNQGGDLNEGDINRSLGELTDGVDYGFLERNGDSNSPATPDWSHNGQFVVYTSTNAPKDGRIGAGSADIYSVPFGGGAGGDATPVEGAADSTAAEYYPDLSPDDRYIAFNRVANPGSAEIYYRKDAEIYVVPTGGGTATRLAANDPPACTGESSPGEINSWPKWSPQARTFNGKTYYWLVFTSARMRTQMFPPNVNPQAPSAEDPRTGQLYVAPIVADADGNLTTYPALYIWNQTVETANLTPAWDEFTIPPPIIR